MTTVDATPTIEHTAAPVLRRRVRPWEPRPAGFLPWQTVKGEADVIWVLYQAVKQGFRQVYLTGGWDAAHTPKREWFFAASAAGWDVRYTPDPRGAKCSRDGVTVDIRMSAAWFGACAETRLIADAYSWLQRMVRSHFDSHAVLMGTPARTGQDLLERSLPTYKGELGREHAYEYPPVPAEVADILRHNVGQGRMEFPALPQTPRESDRLYVLDARWMYASCVRNLPVGPVVHDDGIDFEKFRNGWYRVTAFVPGDWRHIGLLPQWDAEAGRTVWPNEPWTPVHGWASEPELRLALENGWQVFVHERILFAPQSQPGSDPARTWAEKLIAMREGLDKPAGGAVPAAVRPLLSAAVRRLLIDTVGGWYRTSRKQRHVTPHALKDTIPADAIDPTPVYSWDKRGRMSAEPLRWEWSSLEALSQMQLAYQRPEWAAMVWGRARAKLNAAALRIDPARLVALRSDALAVTDYDPAAWPDNGKVGTFRLKREWHWETPRGLPADESAWRELLAEDGEVDDDE